MRRFTWYVVAEFLVAFAATLSAMTVLMMFGLVAREAIAQGLPWSSILKLLPYALPMALLYAVPGTTLFAACLVYGRLSAANEIVALKSLGISPWVVMRPALALAFLLSVVVVWLNDVAVSWGRSGMRRVVLESVEEIAYGVLRNRRAYATGRFSIHVLAVDGRKLVRPVLTINASERDPAVVCRAASAELRGDASRNRLSVFLTRGQIEFGSHGRVVFPDTQVIQIPLSDAVDGYAPDRPQDTALRDIPSRTRLERARLAYWKRRLATDAAVQMIGGDIPALVDVSWKEQHKKLRDARARLNRLLTEPWRRWTNGFACLAFISVGVPLSIQMRNSDVWSSFAACFLPVLVVYYPLLAYGVKLAKAGDLPPFSVWVGNVVFLVVGALLVRRVIRH